MARLAAELRSEIKGDTLVGHAATFRNYARIKNGWEGIARTAFDPVLKDDVPALFNHDMNLVLARTSAGTLRLATDESGLYFEADLGGQSYARDLRESIERGDVNGVSFGFVPDKFERSRFRDGRQLRTHTAMKRLLDVSPTTYPAYEEGTDLMLRSIDLAGLEPEPNKSRLVKARAAALFGGRTT